MTIESLKLEFQLLFLVVVFGYSLKNSCRIDFIMLMTSSDVKNIFAFFVLV